MSMNGLTPGGALKLLLNPDVSKTLILQLAWQRAKLIKKGPLLSKALGSGVVGVSSFIKIPQIRKILDPTTLQKRINVVNGLSYEGISLETLGYLIHVVYNQQNNNSFTNYGETLLLGLQNVVLLLLIKFYRIREVDGNERELLRLLLVIVGLSVALTKFAPTKLIQGLQILSIPISIVLKIPQIQKNHHLKSTSHLSNVTVGANLLGSIIRLFTTIQDFEKLGNDKILLAGYGSSLVLNAVLAAQCYFYGTTEAKKEKED